MENNNILEIKNMHTYFFTDNGTVKSVDGVDIELKKGATLGIVECYCTFSYGSLNGDNR